MPSSSPKPILIVDDEPALLSALEALLSTLGTAVITADSGETALQKSESLDPCVVILDLNLQGIGGIETAERLRDRNPASTAPVLFLSGDAAGERETRAFGERTGGNVGFLMKPVAPIKLLETVRSLMDGC